LDFLLQSNNFLNIIFGLGLELETNQAFQSQAPPCPLNMVRKDNKWMKVVLKWKCKVDISIVTYCAKWLLTKHLKEVHGLWQKRPNLGSFQLLKEVFDIKTMLK
jgi:hypothetical protein